MAGSLGYVVFGVFSVIVILVFAESLTNAAREKQQREQEAECKSESKTKANLYALFYDDAIKKYYRVLTKYNTWYVPTYEDATAKRLKPFFDVALLAGGDAAKTAHEKNERDMEEAGGNFPDGQVYSFFFRLYPFVDIPREAMLALPLSTLTTFLLDTVGEFFHLTASDLTPDATVIQHRINQDLRKQKADNRERKRYGNATLPLIPKPFEEARREHLVQAWSEKLTQYRPAFEDHLKALELALDADVLAHLPDRGYLVYGKPLAHRAWQAVSLFAGAVDRGEDVYKHAYIIGRTGAGKTTLIKNLAAQHINRGDGLIVISPENDLIEALLDRISPERQADLVYFDPTTTASPVVSLNPFTLEEGELLFQRQGEVYTILTSAMGELGENMENLLNKCVYTLLQRPGSSLLDLKRLLRPGDEFRREIVQDTRIDADTREFWRDEYSAKGSYYPKSADAILRRLDAFLMPPLSTSISRASFSLSGALNAQNSLFLFNLSRLKGLQAQMMGQLVVSIVLQTLLARDQQRPADRLPYHLIIDEFQTYAGTSEQAFTDMLNRARKYRMSVTLAHQATENIPAGLLGTIIANAGTLVCLERPASDATYFAKELQLYQEDRAAADGRALQNLRPHHFYLRTPTNKLAALVATELDRFPAIRLPHGFTNHEAWREHLKAKSRRNFGQCIETPEAAEPFRPSPPKPEPPPTDDEGSFGVF